MQAADLKNDIRSGLRRWKHRLIWQRCLALAAAISAWLLTGKLFSFENSTLVIGIISLAGLGFGQLFISHSWRKLNPENFVRHLNRCFADFEESAGLLLLEESKLSVMQSLQRQRVEKVYQENLARVDRWQPVINYRLSTLIIVSALLLSVFANDIRSVTRQHLSSGLPDNEQRGEASASGITISAQVLIRPPEYTGLEPVRTGQLNLEIMQGSLVEWQLAFDGQGESFALHLPEDMRLPLVQTDNGVLVASAYINKTGMYRIVANGDQMQAELDDVYSITVKADRAPDIRLMTPQDSSLELARDAVPEFISEALINDDFGIENVEILASVAKGSGEAVKFRDQILDPGKPRQTGKGIIYRRDWNLQDLGMEPGDEVYFTVLATDNRQPEANIGRSSTLIVRWLDDGGSALAADGLAIDFIPEYFKSQRQIIIDTEQLLEDREILGKQAFRDQSFSIGRSQADLKEKYGQYLGDEVEHGPDLELGENPETGNAEETHDHEDENTGTEFEADSIKLNNTADILQRFGHNHGDPEIGPIGRRNPVALMKRAISEMWQAERHLMQAEPDKALSFEYEAYKYLKLARQADRIYVKRLGFIPPPVSEESRLSGELDDVLDYRTDNNEPQLDLTDKLRIQYLLNDVYLLLINNTSYYKLSTDEQRLLNDLSELFSLWSEQQPEFIRHAVTIEKLLLANRLEANNCENCIANLTTVIWGLVNESLVDFRHRSSRWQASDDMHNSYRQNIQLYHATKPVKQDVPGAQQ